MPFPTTPSLVRRLGLLTLASIPSILPAARPDIRDDFGDARLPAWETPHNLRPHSTLAPAAAGLALEFPGDAQTAVLHRKDVQLREPGDFVSVELALPAGAPATAGAGLAVAEEPAADSKESAATLAYLVFPDGSVSIQIRSAGADPVTHWRSRVPGLKPGQRVRLRLELTEAGRYLFAYSLDGTVFRPVKDYVPARFPMFDRRFVIPGLAVTGGAGSEPGAHAQFGSFVAGRADHDTLFPNFADSHTAGLWLFDDPDYAYATLTDAGLDMYDLRLLPGGSLHPGRFGGALRVSANAGPGAREAIQAGKFEGLPDARPIAPADRLLRALGGKTWTCEFWVKPAGPLAGENVIVELGTGTNQAFRCAVSRAQGAFVLRTSSGETSYLCPTDLSRLTDGRWHHVAFTYEAGTMRHYLDGTAMPAARPGNVNAPQTEIHQGLIGIIRAIRSDNGRISTTRVLNVRVCGSVDFFWGTTKDTSLREQWVGQLDTTALKSGEQDVEFFVECADGARLSIGGETIIDGLANPAVRTGRHRIAAGRQYPLELELQITGTAQRGRLLWRHAGGEWEVIPGSALRHTARDKSTVLEQARDVLEKRFYFTLGAGRFYEQPFDGLLDELRFSDMVRHRGDAFTPRTLSRNFGPNPPKPARPNGPPLLFPDGTATDRVEIGSRKHVFIDDVLVEARNNIHLRAHPPKLCPEDVRGVPVVPDSAYERDGKKIRFIITDADPPQRVDSVNWDGRPFEDANPDATPEERFKYAGRDLQRGIYAFVSPDGLHWRRNETAMFQVDPDGANEMFWDDQRGMYVTYMRHSPLPHSRPPYGRAGALGESTEYFKPWPFRRQAIADRFAKGQTMPSFTGELPTPFEPLPEWTEDPKLFLRDGQIYRTRAVKYPWAPDTYVAFPMRLFFPADGSDQPLASELATSRDGRNWRFFGEPYFYPIGWQLEPGFQVVTAVSRDALVREGDELWTYAILTDGTHHRRSENRRIIRFVSRLDGFTSLEAAAKPGWVRTRSFVFQGGRLELNVAARGMLRIGILDEQGNEIPEFTARDCDPIRADTTRHTVTWKGRADVRRLAGQPVRLRIEMQDANLYAFQFTD